MSFVKPTLDLKTSIWESTYTSPKWVYPCLNWTKLKPYNKFIYETLVYYHSKDFKCSSELETSEDIFLGGVYGEFNRHLLFHWEDWASASINPQVQLTKDKHKRSFS